MRHSPPSQNPHASEFPHLTCPQPVRVKASAFSPKQLSEREASSSDGFLDELLESEKAGFAVVSQSVSVHPTPSLSVVAHSSSQGTRCKEKAVSCFWLCTWLLPLFPYAFFTGPWFLNWTPYSDLLVHTGVYGWLCSDSHALPPQPSPQGIQTAGKCLAQQEAISFLFTVASTTTFCCSVLSGLLLDHLGSTVCALVGWGCMAAGWGLLACSSQAFDAYPWAMGLLGFSLDAAFFPLITEARRSGQHSSFVVSSLGACRSGAFALPLALRCLNQHGRLSLPQLCLLVGILSCGCCVFLAFICLPKKIPLLAALRSRRQRNGDTQRAAQRDARRPSSLLEPLELQAAAVRGLEASLRERTAAAAAARRHLQMQQQQQQQQSSILKQSPQPSLPAGEALPSLQQQQEQQQQQQREQPQAAELQQQQEQQHNKGQEVEPQETPHRGRQQLQPTDQQRHQEQQQQQQKLPACSFSNRGAAHLSRTSEAANAFSPAAAAAAATAAEAETAAAAATAAEAETAAAEATEAAAAVAAKVAARGQQERGMGMQRVSTVSSEENVFLLEAKDSRRRRQEETGFCVFILRLKREMGDPRFYLLVLFAFINVLNTSFYLPSTVYLMSTGYTANQLAHVFPFVVAPFWGFIADWAGIVPTMAACNLATIAAHSLLLPQSPSTLQQGVSAVFSVIRLSFMASQVYCYSNQTFSRLNTGTLIGITWSLAGLGPVAAGAMRKRGLEEDAFRRMLGITVSLAAFNEALLAVLYFITRRQPFTVYRQMEERDQTAKERDTANPLRAPIPKAVADCLCKAAAPPAAVSPQQQGAEVFAATAGSPTGFN